MKKLQALFIFVCLLTTNIALANDIGTLRNGQDISTQEKSQPIPKPITDDIKVGRNYPMQPPIIPHNIRDYQVDLNVNKCLSCHSRNRVSESQATMVSVTHYMDRDGNFLADVSPRRYFCTQCHVTQKDTKPLIENDFIDMKKLIAIKAQSAK
ncbi:nitrate reductase cytochrome c-type subunit [Paraglaciecola sp.]|uniref:nitrate reductase cytochrome c-type subunit n=1 Tax=Paraglaciecola sp. TaxID=1920173 RepID=UPI003EFA84E3